MLNKGSRTKASNRTRFHRNVASGFTSSHGKARYSFHLTQGFAGLTLRRVHAPPGRVGVAGGWKLHRAEGPTLVLALSADRRALSETADHISANMNLTEIDESYNNSGNINHLYTYFDVDDLNRVSSHRTKVICQLTPGLAGLALRRVQAPPGRAEEHRSPNFHVVRTSAAPRRQPDTRFGLSGRPASPWMSGQKNRDRSRMLQNYDGSAYGAEWRWAGAQNSHSSPLKSPNADTASQTGYNIANDKTPQRRSFLSPTSEGDQRNLYGQGKPQAKDSTGGGANWYIGVTSQPQAAQYNPIESRLFFEGTVTATDMSRATDTREKGRIGITGSAQAYGGSNGRVTSEAIGRDINPLGRGSGAALVGGMMSEGKLAPSMPGSSGEMNQGNSVNNECAGCRSNGWDVEEPGFNPDDSPKDPGNEFVGEGNWLADPSILGGGNSGAGPVDPGIPEDGWDAGFRQYPPGFSPYPELPDLPGLPKSDADKFWEQFRRNESRKVWLRAKSRSVSRGVNTAVGNVRETCCNQMRKTKQDCRDPFQGDTWCKTVFSAVFDMPDTYQFCREHISSNSSSVTLCGGRAAKCALLCLLDAIMDALGINYGALADIVDHIYDAIRQNWVDLLSGGFMAGAIIALLTSLLKGLGKIAAKIIPILRVILTSATFIGCMTCCIKGYNICKNYLKSGKCKTAGGGLSQSWSHC